DVWNTLPQDSGPDLLQRLEVEERRPDARMIDDEVELRPIGCRLGNVCGVASLGNVGRARSEPLVDADIEETGASLQLLLVLDDELVCRVGHRLVIDPPRPNCAGVVDVYIGCRCDV